MPDWSRRDLLTYSVACSVLAIPCGLSPTPATAAALCGSGIHWRPELMCDPSAKSAADASGDVHETYYALHRAALTAAFRGIAEGAQQVWAPEFGVDRSRAMTREALDAFDKLLDGFPDVGGDKNRDSQFIPVAGWYVALYGPMRSAGKAAEDVGRLIYDMYLGMLEATPREQATRECNDLFSANSLANLESWAEWTQRREYKANFVATFVRGDGKDFDFGYDYSECALVKYFKSKGVPELAPYVCLNDFLKSAAIGSGLHRTKTIAQGDDICNFRFKKGRPVTQNWTTEIDLIRSRMRA